MLIGSGIKNQKNILDYAHFVEYKLYKLYKVFVTTKKAGWSFDHTVFWILHSMLDIHILLHTIIYNRLNPLVTLYGY